VKYIFLPLEGYYYIQGELAFFVRCILQKFTPPLSALAQCSVCFDPGSAMKLPADSRLHESAGNREVQRSGEIVASVPQKGIQVGKALRCS
jgi:hypothetical protein